MNKTYTQQTQKERKQKELDSVSDTLFFRTIPPFLRKFRKLNSTLLIQDGGSNYELISILDNPIMFQKTVS